MSEGELRLLTAMPLHAITALHGEAGLQERFAIEIATSLMMTSSGVNGHSS
jgi:hypothetical protein